MPWALRHADGELTLKTDRNFQLPTIRRSVTFIWIAKHLWLHVTRIKAKTITPFWSLKKKKWQRIDLLWKYHILLSGCTWYAGLAWTRRSPRPTGKQDFIKKMIKVIMIIIIIIVIIIVLTMIITIIIIIIKIVIIIIIITSWRFIRQYYRYWYYYYYYYYYSYHYYHCFSLNFGMGLTPSRAATQIE